MHNPYKQKSSEDKVNRKYTPFQINPQKKWEIHISTIAWYSWKIKCSKGKQTEPTDQIFYHIIKIYNLTLNPAYKCLKFIFVHKILRKSCSP